MERFAEQWVWTHAAEEGTGALGKPCTLYPWSEDHKAQEPERGSEKSDREGISWIFISSVFSELSVAFGTFVGLRGEGMGTFTMKLPKLIRGPLWDAASVDLLYFGERGRSVLALSSGMGASCEI